MNLYTIGFAQKTAEQFFGLLENNHVDLLLDIRLNNKSQLAGFTKGNDLKFFLYTICNCEYRHCIEYAPTKDILDRYKKNEISWSEYEEKYIKLLIERGDFRNFYKEFEKYKNVCLLCSEPSAIHCHRRLAAELISQNNPQIAIKHL